MLGDNAVTFKLKLFGAECLFNAELCTAILVNNEFVFNTEKSVEFKACKLVVQKTPYSAQLDTLPISPVLSIKAENCTVLLPVNPEGDKLISACVTGIGTEWSTVCGLFPVSTAFGITSVVDFISKPSTSQSASAVIIKLSANKTVLSAVIQTELGANLSGTIGDISIVSGIYIFISLILLFLIRKRLNPILI